MGHNAIHQAFKVIGQPLDRSSVKQVRVVNKGGFEAAIGFSHHH